MGRRPTSGRANIRQSDLFEIGDELFFTQGNGTMAGEGLYIGHVPGNAQPALLAKPGMPGTEFEAADCKPTGHRDPTLGHRLREGHLHRFPGSLT